MAPTIKENESNKKDRKSKRKSSSEKKRREDEKTMSHPPGEEEPKVPEVLTSKDEWSPSRYTESY
jgi:hypothetical protein